MPNTATARDYGELELRGAGGEPVLLARTLASHGVASLPPSRIDEEAWTLEVTLPLPRTGARTVRVAPARNTHARVELLGPAVSERNKAHLVAQLRHMFRLDEDLSPFYSVARDDEQLSWAAAGAGRMLRSPTVFEDVVKTICTTNCAWSGTVRMVSALVDHLGARAPTGAHAFPKPEKIAEAPDAFLRDVARAGYRGPYIRTLARSARLAPGELRVGRSRPRIEHEPGVAPERGEHHVGGGVRAHAWQREEPLFDLRVGQLRIVQHFQVERRFRRYGDFAGLAFWLLLTRGWVPED
ncbi:MAG: Fe-S cluster assembly protein HesB [Actinobacteria bacterium]|nr:MAG: Fe-S cluster assembly protein HesB [Actinomycetota bacterium]